MQALSGSVPLALSQLTGALEGYFRATFKHHRRENGNGTIALTRNFPNGRVLQIRITEKRDDFTASILLDVREEPVEVHVPLSRIFRISTRKKMGRECHVYADARRGAKCTRVIFTRSGTFRVLSRCNFTSTVSD